MHINQWHSYLSCIADHTSLSSLQVPHLNHTRCVQPLTEPSVLRGALHSSRKEHATHRARNNAVTNSQAHVY